MDRIVEVDYKNGNKNKDYFLSTPCIDGFAFD